MPIEPIPENLIKIQTELNLVRAQHSELKLRIRRGELIERAKFEADVFRLARRVRDQILTAPARHVATLAATYNLAPGTLAAALDSLLRAELAEIAPPKP
jgi:hypothetical protein